MVGPAKSILARMEERGGSDVSILITCFLELHYEMEIKTKIAIQAAKIIHSHLPHTVKKVLTNMKSS